MDSGLLYGEEHRQAMIGFLTEHLRPFLAHSCHQGRRGIFPNGQSSLVNVRAKHRLQLGNICFNFLSDLAQLDFPGCWFVSHQLLRSTSLSRTGGVEAEITPPRLSDLAL